MATPDRSKPEPANGWSYCSYLNSASTVIGNLVLQDGATVDGIVEGEIKGLGHLIIGETAEITGQIEAPSVAVLGRVNGDIKATRIDIGASARISGNLISPIVLIEPGAVLNGHCFVPEDSAEEHRSRVDHEMIVLEEPVANSAEEHPQQGVSFFITKRQRAELCSRGYDDAAIDKMTPVDAHKILGIV